MLCKGTVDWLYKLDEDYEWKSPYEHEKDWFFGDKKGNTWLHLKSDGHIVVKEGYCWDGCTPKFCFMDIQLGTPEGAISEVDGKPKTWHASLVHDALCQYLPAGLPLNQKQVDDIMLTLLQDREFGMSRFYYIAVRAFGWFSKPLTGKLRKYDGKNIDPPEDK